MCIRDRPRNVPTESQGNRLVLPHTWWSGSVGCKAVILLHLSVKHFSKNAHCAQSELLPTMNGINSEFWCHERSAVWPSETKRHAVDGRKTIQVRTGNTNASCSFIWDISVDEVQWIPKKPVGSSQTSMQCHKFRDKIISENRLKLKTKVMSSGRLGETYA